MIKNFMYFVKWIRGKRDFQLKSSSPFHEDGAEGEEGSPCPS